MIVRRCVLVTGALVALAACGGQEGASSDGEPAAPLAVEVVRSSDCREVPVPEHGPVPRPDDVDVRPEPGGRVRITIANVHASCPDEPVFSIARDGTVAIVTIEHRSSGAPLLEPHGRYRDVELRVTGLPSDVHRIGVRSDDADSSAGTPLFDLPR